MFNKFRNEQYASYQRARKHLTEDPSILLNLEKYFAKHLYTVLLDNIEVIKADYNEASYLYPFWQQYPPDERGRQPRGDQYPWIEVGEHAIGDKLPRLLAKDFEIRDVGIPTGPDKRFVLKSENIQTVSKGFTNSAWLFIDIKSVGPRDDADHTVMSHNQISGDGLWIECDRGVKNTPMVAMGKYAKHDFHCSVPPLYVLSDGLVVPVILIAIKPVYKMLTLENGADKTGQPLHRITIVAIPNGLLLEENPGYLKQFPRLLFPGKDDKEKNPLKVRSRISFAILKEIGAWRIQEIVI